MKRKLAQYPGLEVPVHLMLLAMPIIASMISRTVMSLVDFVMVSQLGTEAQAAIMPAGVLLFCVVAFGMGVVSMVNSFVAQSYGRGELHLCSMYSWQGFYLSVGFGLLFLPFWFLAEPYFNWVGHDPQVVRMEVDYVQVGLLSLVPSIAAISLSNFFNGIHRPIPGLIAAVIGNVVNVIANYALIYGNFGFEPMGMAGAAWGTVLGATVNMLVLLVWKLAPSLHAQYQTRVMWHLNLKAVRSILWFGTPAGLHFLVDIAAFTIFTQLLIGRFGTVQLAASNLAFRYLEVSFMPTVGLGVAVTAAVGKAIGQGDPARARAIVWWGTAFAMGYMGIVALLYVTAGGFLAGLLTGDEHVIQWAVRIMLLCAIFQLFDAVGIIHISALRGAGDTFWPAIAGAILAGSIFIGGGFFLVYKMPQLESLGPWIAATAYIMVLGIAMLLRWLAGRWESIHMTDSSQPPIVEA